MSCRSIDSPLYPSTTHLWIGWPIVSIDGASMGSSSPRRQKKVACRSTPPKQTGDEDSVLGAGGSCRGGRLGFPVAAAERLDAELGELLGPDAIVRLDHRAHGVGQSLSLDHDDPELLRRLLLASRQHVLLLVDLPHPGQVFREL